MHVPLTEVILTHDGTELARATLPPGEYVIGREAGVDLHADTPLLSRRHARLTINYDHLLLEDLGSSNGTFVNERPVTEPTRLFPNQPIRLGPDLALEIRRQRAPTEAGVSLAPAQAAIARHLPEELLAQRRYAIGGVVAQGGMGAILDARQSAMKRTVAMKVMLDTASEADVLRFIDEAQITGQLDHPNIVPIHELGVDEQGQVFYTMKMVRGITLKAVLAELAAGDPAAVAKYPLPVLLTVFQKVCDALAFAHSRGVIHRDLKPENLMLGDFGSVLVMDWGLAKIVGKNETPGTDPARSAVLSARSAEGDASFTMVGSIMGTPAYMSPEQARGEIDQLAAPSDIYALGAILFEILHLRPAHTGRAAMEIVDKVGRGEVAWTPPKSAIRNSQHAIPASLLAVVRKAMALAAAARYPRVEDLQADLLAYQTGFATSAEKAGAWKQFTLLVKRHQAASLGLTAVLLVGATLGTKAILEGRRAEREATLAKATLNHLRETAPALRALVEREASMGRFDSALQQLDAAMAIDATHLPSYWRRAWLLLGAKRFAESADAIRLARERDPANRQLADILPVVEGMAAAPSDAERWTTGRTGDLHHHLIKVEAHTELAALAGDLKLGREERIKLVRRRLDEWLGAGQGDVGDREGGYVAVALPKSTATIEPLTGLPIDILILAESQVRSLEPLRGMVSLAVLDLAQTPVIDLSPLRGLRLRDISLWGTRALDLSPLSGMPLEKVMVGSLQTQMDWLRGAPMRRFLAVGSGFTDLQFLADSPLEVVQITNGPVSDLRPLARTPVRDLLLAGLPNLRSLAALLEARSLEKLTLLDIKAPIEPLRQHPSLKFIHIGGVEGFDPRVSLKPVAQFWAEYDAEQAAGKK